MRIPVNPRLPKSFDSTPNNERSEAQIRRWWCLPFVVGKDDNWSVRCLDGGAWDRSTWHGSWKTEEAAVAYAEALRSLYWGSRESNEMPVAYPYEMRFSPAGDALALKCELVGPASDLNDLKASHQSGK